MKIGVDLDGVVYDTERAFRYYADFFSCFELGKERVHPEFTSQEKAFEWTEQETKTFFEKYLGKIILAGEMIGAREVLQLLQKEGHELFVITSRGINDNQAEIDWTIPKLKELGVDFAGMFFAQRGKFDKCKELGIDVMIDDRYENVAPFAGSDIVALHFREAKAARCCEKNIIEVDGWMDIYRQIHKILVYKQEK